MWMCELEWMNERIRKYGAAAVAAFHEGATRQHDYNNNNNIGNDDNDNIHSVELPHTMRIMQAKYFHNNNNTFIRRMSWI